MRVRVTLAPSLMLAVFATACGGGADAPKAASSAPGTQAVPAVAAGELGVPECDRYWTKYLACIDSKVPEANRAMVRLSLDQSRGAGRAGRRVHACRGGHEAGDGSLRLLLVSSTSPLSDTPRGTEDG
jgi:hypothetical protein